MEICYFEVEEYYTVNKLEVLFGLIAVKET